MSSPYFRRRESRHAMSFDDRYWVPKTDPEGVVRDGRQERQRRVEDCRDELAFINALPPGRVLEVGCGFGHLLSAIDTRWCRHGVEPSQAAAAEAALVGTIFTGTFEETRYPDEFFDAVLMYQVIEHMEDPVTAMRIAWRILMRGGWLVVTTPNFDSACARRFGDNYRMYHDPTHVSLFTPESMREMLLDVGFDVDRVEYPYFDTRYFTPDNLLRLFDTTKVSPPFYGNLMTFYARKASSGAVSARLRATGRGLIAIARDSAEHLAPAVSLLERAAKERWRVEVWSDSDSTGAASMVATALARLGVPCDVCFDHGPELAEIQSLVVVVTPSVSGRMMSALRDKALVVTGTVSPGQTPEGVVVIPVGGSDSEWALRAVAVVTVLVDQVGSGG